MTKILFYQNPLSQAPKWPPLRQTFLGSGSVMGGRFHFTIEDTADCDYLLTGADGVIPVIRSHIPKERRVVILMENPSIWSPPIEYLDFFGVVITPTTLQVNTGTKLIINQPAVSWFYGLKFRTDRGLSHEPVLENFLQLDDLAEIDSPKKEKLLSCVVSNKSGTSGYNWRIETALALKSHFGENIDMYGFGWNPISDKRDAIDSYHFSVVIENESRANYWTEKLSDAILGFSEPIYAGAPNIRNFFNSNIETIDFGSPVNDSIKRVENIIRSIPKRDDLLSRRHQILFEHNLFYYVARLIESNQI